jgi:hypothetical protein
MDGNEAPKRGGKREGAGRKKGSKQKIAKTYLTKSALIAAADGEMPLQYMLRVMRDPLADEKRRDAMATAAATYIHPKLSSVTGSFTHKHEPTELSDAELVDIATSGSLGTPATPQGKDEPSRVH